MADARVEVIESDSDSSGFDNDYSNDSDDNHYQKEPETFLQTQIVKTMKFFRDFPSKCLKM